MKRSCIISELEQILKLRTGHTGTKVDSLLVTKERLYFLYEELPTFGGMIIEKDAHLPPNPIIYDLALAERTMTGLERRAKEAADPHYKKYGTPYLGALKAHRDMQKDKTFLIR